MNVEERCAQTVGVRTPVSVYYDVLAHAGITVSQAGRYFFLTNNILS